MEERTTDDAVVLVELSLDSLDSVAGGMNMDGHRVSENLEDCRANPCINGDGVPFASSTFDGNFWRETSTVTTGDFSRFDRGASEPYEAFPNLIDFNLIVDSGDFGGAGDFGGFGDGFASVGDSFGESGGGAGHTNLEVEHALC